jgi:hypothetical protein
MFLVCLAFWTSVSAHAQETLTLENGRLGLKFDRSTGSLIAIENKVAGETYQVRNDLFEVEACEFHVVQADAKLTSLRQEPGAVKARYEAGPVAVEVAYALREDNHFAEKRLTLVGARNYGLKNIVLTRPTFSADGLRIVTYRYPRINAFRTLLNLGETPNSTFFVRSSKGGLFTGTEVPFDASSVMGQQVVLRYAPSLKVMAGERLDCEPVYFGVYRRGPYDGAKQGAHYGNLWAGDTQEPPLRSESDAMVAMVSAIFGKPRFGLMPVVNGWHSEMCQGAHTAESLAGDLEAVDFVAECGIDWLSLGNFWGGEQKKVGALGLDEKYVPGPMLQELVERARAKGIKSLMGSSLNDIYEGKSKRFCFDQQDWIVDAGATPPGYAPDWRKKERGNCFANRPFFDWMTRINLEATAAGFAGWEFDGDYFGSIGWACRVDCQSNKHDHLPGDSNYASQRAMDRLQAALRKQFPEIFIFMYRPGQDLGVWAMRNTDVSFTILEDALHMEENLAGGDKVRTWSRVRVQREFLPNYMDQSLLFPVPASERKGHVWPKGHLDYILLSALSCSPNQLFYLPTRTGIPAADKAEIRRWLDWGRKNIEYLQVRKDLPDWPAPGKVDGSAHLVGNRGLIFFFNSSDAPLPGEFALTEESIGLKGQGEFQIIQEYPPSDHAVKTAFGETVRWEIPAQTAVVLKIEQVKKPPSAEPAEVH